MYKRQFYNWYDTLTLKPLLPLYVSSVDSGNLSGHLLTLRPGLLALVDQPILGVRTFEGLSDTMAIIMDMAADRSTPALSQLRCDIESAYDARPTTLASAHCWLEKLSNSAEALATQFGASSAATPDDALNGWIQALFRQCQAAFDELSFLTPWMPDLSLIHI